MKLIADCGSTKIDWCLTEGKEVIRRFETPGMNAVMLTAEEIEQRMADELAPGLGEYADTVPEVYFYGAGCVSPAVCANVANAIKAVTPNAKVEVSTDLLAAARSLCGHGPGIACIMGTGSNSCYFDGEKIVKSVSPLGYILGDEGSGAVLGKLLVGNVLKGQLPADLCTEFLEEYQLDNLKIIERVYRMPAANKFLASLSPFLKKHIDRPEVRQMVQDAFRQFFVRNVSHFDEITGGFPFVNFVGSIAYYYSDVLEDAASISGYRLGKVLKSPMEGLIEYHAV